MLSGHALPPIQMKGIAIRSCPMSSTACSAAKAVTHRAFSEHMPGLDLYLDPSRLDEAAAARTRALLEQALATLETRPKPAT